MPKQIFADDSDSDIEIGIKIDNKYAKNYDVWRKKEELNKLKTKYGENLELNEEDYSSTSDDDEDGVELTEKVEKDFFKTLAALKNKDPKIYNGHIKFFDEADKESNAKTSKKKKEQPVFLKDYERKLLLEKGGVLSDNDEERPSSPTFAEEQQSLKEQIKKGLDKIEDDDIGITERKKTKEEKQKEEADYKKWLAGQVDIIDENIEYELKPLKDYWNNPNLDEGEKFLRDYVLNKKFLDKDDENYIPTYDEIIHDSDENLSHDEEEIENQEEFEHKYNFRFEEPDQEFIKRYPRTLNSSLRKKDDRRTTKRAELKERKKKEKEDKFADLRKLQELKRKEIEEKIEKLKEITGNADVDFNVDDIDADFDPETHDKRMQALFNNEFYEGSEEEQKPVFPDIDEELEIENWDHWDGTEVTANVSQKSHCDDEDFNMDADYDPSQSSTQQELIEQSKGKKKRRRKSKFAQALATPKPKYDPYDKNYEKYFEEYYKLDCEDIIGDIPCRFKYREVIPNDFGLTVEEILLAKDRELNKWCSLKKSVQRRPEHVEKYEQKVYAQKAKNWNLKKKILPSLFVDEPGAEISTSHGDGYQRNLGESVMNLPNSLVESGNKKTKVTNVEEAGLSNENIRDFKRINDNIEITNEQKTKQKKRKYASENGGDSSKPKKIRNNSLVENGKKKTKLTSVEEADVSNEIDRGFKRIHDNIETSNKQKSTKQKKRKNGSENENSSKPKNIRDNNLVENGKKKTKLTRVEGAGVSNEINHDFKRINDNIEISNEQNGSKQKKRKNESENRDSSKLKERRNNCPTDAEIEVVNDISKNINKKKKAKSSNTEINKLNGQTTKRKFGLSVKGGILATSSISKKQNKNKKEYKMKDVDTGLTDARLVAYGINPKKFKNKLKYGHTNK